MGCGINKGLVYYFLIKKHTQFKAIITEYMPKAYGKMMFQHTTTRMHVAKEAVNNREKYVIGYGRMSYIASLYFRQHILFI